MARRLIPIALLVLSGSCSNPTGPSSFDEPTSLTITGPARVAPGTTAQYSSSHQ